MHAPRCPLLALLGLAALTASLHAAPLALARARQDDPARALFLKNCASCHGENGDGQGTTQLDRPARSFQDGGFSFGNTPEALFKTISTGIPGSPMAGFDSSLTEEERRTLAAYVVTLGPPVEEVKEEDMVLAVHERPLVVRGLLPSLGEGLPTHPRGLLIGDPSGITFEYDVADVRLLALRQGGFVKRTDWSGRGGTPLEPLGKVVHLIEGGKPGATFGIAGGSIPLDARLAGTRLAGAQVVLDYHLVLGSRELAHVTESPRVRTTPSGTGFLRSFELQAGPRPVHLALHDPTQGPGVLRLVAADGKRAQSYGARRSTEQGTSEHAIRIEAERWSRKDGVAIVELAAGARAHIELLTVPAVQPQSPQQLEALLQQMVDGQ